MNNVWKIKPSKSIGPISFGMSKQSLMAVLTGEFETFRKTGDSREDTLAFDSDFVHVTVDDNELIKQISVFRGREVFLGGIQLLGRNVESLLVDLDELDLRFESFNGGLWCESAKIVLVEVDGEVDGIEMELHIK